MTPVETTSISKTSVWNFSWSPCRRSESLVSHVQQNVTSISHFRDTLVKIT